MFDSFLDDMVLDGMDVWTLTTEDMKDLSPIARKFNLDFDDAYQYLAAEKFNLQLISFDKDFDRTEQKRKEPSEVM